jgi:ferritin-like metal-binding protein YciE
MLYQNQLPDENPNKVLRSKLHELYVVKLMELYYWEMKMLETLTLLQTASDSPILQKKIAMYHIKKGEQVENLQQIFILLDLPIAGKKCNMISLLLESCEELTNERSVANDDQLYGMLLTISHFNQTSYNWLISLSSNLQIMDIELCLTANLTMEQEFTIRLSEVLDD